MKELEELTREIREKLPRLKYLISPPDPMLNDVLEWMPDNSVFMNMTGGFWKDGKIDTLSDCQSYMTDIIQLGKWDLSNPYLKDQSPELISFLHGLIKTR